MDKNSNNKAMINKQSNKTMANTNNKNNSTNFIKDNIISKNNSNNLLNKDNSTINNTYSFTVSGTTFIVDKRYEFIKLLGVGAYGVVVSCLDKKLNLKVAIKKVQNAFEDLIDAKRILREIKLLNFFDHENIIKLIDVPLPEKKIDYNDIYIVSDLMETDLHKVIYSKQELSDEHIQYFIYQILRGVLYIHSANVVHRDLKPSNILANKNCDLKICDLGLGRGGMPEYNENNENERVSNYPVSNEVNNNNHLLTE